jgi:hypothetical protein
MGQNPGNPGLGLHKVENGACGYPFPKEIRNAPALYAVEIRADPLPGKPKELFPRELAGIPHLAEDPQPKILEI